MFGPQLQMSYVQRWKKSDYEKESERVVWKWRTILLESTLPNVIHVLITHTSSGRLFGSRLEMWYVELYVKGTNIHILTSHSHPSNARLTVNVLLSPSTLHCNEMYCKLLVDVAMKNESVRHVTTPPRNIPRSTDHDENFHCLYMSETVSVNLLWPLPDQKKHVWGGICQWARSPDYRKYSNTSN